MQKALLVSILILFFSIKINAQEGIIAIARYGQTEAPKFRYDDSLTEFSGGFEAFKNLFLKEFKMPTKALTTVKAPDGMVGFTVNLVGKIVDIEIIDSVTTEVDAEVVRVLTAISEFHPQVNPLKFAIQYNVYPDWFVDWVKEQEAAEKYKLHSAKMDSLLKSKKLTDLKKYTDKTKAYGEFDIWGGFANMNDPLSKYLKTSFGGGGDLNVVKNKWFAGVSLQLRGTRVKKDFDHIDAYWAKDTSVNLFSMGLMCGYKIIDEDKLAFTPFVGIGFGSLALPSTPDQIALDGSTIDSFVPTLGVFVDYKIREKVNRIFFDSRLSTTTVRLRLAVNPMNFKDGRHGNVVDLGIGFSVSQRVLKFD